MEIIGTIEQILDKSRPPYKKKVAVIQDGINPKNTWCVEFRKNLSEVVSVFQPGDRIKVTFRNEARIDVFFNYYNNLIAEKIERI